MLATRAFKAYSPCDLILLLQSDSDHSFKRAFTKLCFKAKKPEGG